MINLIKKIWSYNITFGYAGGKVRLVLLICMFISLISTIIAEDSWGIIIPDWVIWAIIIVWVVIMNAFKVEKNESFNMKKLLLFIPLMFFFSCGGEENEINADSEIFMGNWILKKYYYSDGMNGLYEGECDIPGSILVDDYLNQVFIPTECNLNTPLNIVFDIDFNGNLYNFENYNFLDKNVNIDSVNAQSFDVSNVVGIDSISVYYKLYVPNGMYVSLITGNKLN